MCLCHNKLTMCTHMQQTHTTHKTHDKHTPTCTTHTSSAHNIYTHNIRTHYTHTLNIRTHTQHTQHNTHTQHIADVPAQVVAYVDRIIAMARENHTGVFKASQILEYIFDAFAYGEFASRDTFDLKRHCLGSLEEHDKTLKRVVGERYKANMESAEKLIDECITILSKILNKNAPLSMPPPLCALPIFPSHVPSSFCSMLFLFAARIITITSSLHHHCRAL